ncbi:hypothetical protein [Clavibacter michiganensis]|uniref:hypothetical protein n=1 Tax=Clavibacter michiganensis TaxID=28447 RepID=UPI0011AFF16B|nr:hypothetical protein [Clavibacter michiganensis]
MTRVSFTNRRTRVVAAALAVLFCSGLITAATTPEPAEAAADFRKAFPIAAGSSVYNSRHQPCTVGAVLKANGFFANITEVQRKTRYLVIAGHCGNNGQDIGLEGHGVVGRIIWESGDADLAIVRVDPSVTHRPHCMPNSQLHNCTILTTVSPLATGRIFLRSPFSGQPRSFPIQGTGVPGADERFCTSGATTGINCNWSTVPLPEGFGAHQAGAQSDGLFLEGGDSGGPVAGRAGQLYGIIARMGNDLGPARDIMSYTPIARLFQEQSGYSIAPPN